MTSHFPQAEVLQCDEWHQTSIHQSSNRIGRAREYQQFLRWLTTETPATQIFSLSGIGGIGKTTLMMDMSHRARQDKFRVVWLDCRTGARMPTDFLTSLEMSLFIEYGISRDVSVPLLTHIVRTFAQQKIVLFMDNCENIDLIESWLLTSFLPQLHPNGILLVLASRSGLPISWQTNPYWRSRLNALHLDVFTDQELRAYLAPYALPNEIIELIARQTHGHPLSVALAVEVLQFHDNQPSQVSRWISGVISAELLKEVTEPSLHEALQILSVLSVANQTELAKLTKRPLELGPYHALAKLSFVHSSPRGLALHDVVRQVLRQDLQQRDPETFKKLCTDTIRLLADQYPVVNSAEQIRIASQVLELYGWLRAIRHVYADFSIRPKTGPHRFFQMEDLPHLHRLLADSLNHQNWQCELISPDQHHALLDALAVDCPEGIRVVRSETGVPLVFNAGVWLHSQTIPLLETYAPRILTEVLTEEAERLRMLPAEFMDSVIVLLSAVDMRHPLYKPEELGVLPFEDWFSFTSAGARSMLVTGDPLLTGLVQLFGFHFVKHLAPEILVTGVEVENKITVFELDFRNAQFPAWVQKMIQELDSLSDSSQPGDNPSSMKADRMPPLSSGISLRETAEVEEILKAVQSIEQLDRTQFARQQKIPGMELQHRIQQLLTSETPVFPMTKLYQSILRESFLNNEIGKGLLAERFNMSRTTFYRHSRRAMLQFAQALIRSYTIENE